MEGITLPDRFNKKLLTEFLNKNGEWLTHFPNEPKRKRHILFFISLLLTTGKPEEYVFITSINLEKHIYNYTIINSNESECSWDNSRFQKDYSTKFNHIYLNLNPDTYIKNTRLLTRLLNEEFTLEELVYKMEPKDIFPERWVLEEDAIYEQSKFGYRPGVLINDEKSGFKCWKCKSMRCSYYQLMVKSADESMTTFITCLDCENRWRIG